MKKLTISSIIIWLISFCYILIYPSFSENINTNSTPNPLLSLFSDFSPIVLIIIFVIFIPIIEEIAFRYWTSLKKTTIITSCASTSLLFFIVFNSIFISMFILFMLLFLFYFIRNLKNKTIIITIITSILFSLLHYNNIGDQFNWIYKASYHLNITSAGVILAAIGLKTKFIYCIIAHSLNNLVAFSLLLFLFNKNIYNIESNTYIGKIETHSIFSNKKTNEYITKDSIQIFNSLSNLMRGLHDFKNDTFYMFYTYDFMQYDLTVNSIDEFEISKEELIKDIVSLKNIKTVSIEKNAYTLKLLDTINFNANASENNFYINLDNYLSFLRNKKVMIKKEANTPNIILNLESSILSEKNIGKIRNNLKTHHNIDISNTENSSITVISYSL
ncbi:MAG: CPBP family intramembrane glutamic endopeptidase [Bacteroidales bacterium]|nr:CPBP family intramembrane metalloprotease [Bacteroidales bacterium]MDY0217118.1 CPBP family intramembrane glutamic endopeptidase [Bacteroidales bacterium]